MVPRTVALEQEDSARLLSDLEKEVRDLNAVLGQVRQQPRP